MITIQLLEDTDLLLPTDWCRPLELVSMSGGMSDSYSFVSMYGGLPENNVKWVQVDRVFGNPWWGTPVGGLNKDNDLTPYEFARGPIPREHQLTGFEPLPKASA